MTNALGTTPHAPVPRRLRGFTLAGARIARESAAHQPARAPRRSRGFTLIELMIVVVVIAILAAIAYPSYQGSVRKTKRADGKTQLMETAQALERCLTRFGRYDDASCSVELPVMSEEGHYEVDGEVNPASFTLKATPQGAQADDTECGVLVLTQTGAQGSQDSSTTDANDCW